MPVVAVLLAVPVKVLRLYWYRICSGAVRLNSSKQCAYTRHLVHIRVVTIDVQYSIRVDGPPVHWPSSKKRFALILHRKLYVCKVPALVLTLDCHKRAILIPPQK